MIKKMSDKERLGKAAYDGYCSATSADIPIIKYTLAPWVGLDDKTRLAWIGAGNAVRQMVKEIARGTKDG